MPARKPIEIQFWSKVNKRGARDCWEWMASTRKPQGYGQIMVNGVLKLAHRVSYELTNGPIPQGTLICHHCDNPPCVNPAHLFSGTNQDNVNDAIRKGRISQKVSPAAANQIRQMRAAGFPLKTIAKRFGIDQSLVSRIANGKRKKNL